MFLIILQETLSNGYKAEYLDLISLISIFFGVSIIISKNPILSVLFLICLFSGISIYLIMLGLYFIGISYLLVYVGAISILFLFILMLINVRISELLTDNKNSIPLAVIAVLSFNSSVQEILPYSVTVFNIISSYLITSVKDFIFSDNWSYYIKSSFNILGNTNFLEIAKVKSKIWDANLAETSHITSIGNIMYTGFSILLIITSLILLLAMVGTIVITINKSKVTTTSVNSKTFINTS